MELFNNYQKEKRKKLDLVQILLLLSGVFASGMFVWNFCQGEIAAQYFVAIIAVIIGWITYRVALSADKSAKVVVELQQRAHELEERNEAPYVVPMARDVNNPYSQIYNPNNVNDDDNNQFWIILRNLGNGPAFDIKSEHIISKHILNKYCISFLRVDDTFPAKMNEVQYMKFIYLKDLPNEEISSKTYLISYKDTHDNYWQTKFNVALSKYNDHLKLHINNIHREKAQTL